MLIREIRKHRNIILACLVVFLITAWISHNYFQLMLLQGRSMEPALHPYQLLILDKRHPDQIEQGDIIAFRCETIGETLVKRVAALPGQTVVIHDGSLLIDGEMSAFYDPGTFQYAGLLNQSIYLSDGEYIVLGDNVEESKDSRYPEIGIVQLEQIIGRVF